NGFPPIVRSPKSSSPPGARSASGNSSRRALNTSASDTVEKWGDVGTLTRLYGSTEAEARLWYAARCGSEPRYRLGRCQQPCPAMSRHDRDERRPSGRVRLRADRQENRGARGLARGDVGQGPAAHQGRRPGDRRRVEVGEEWTRGNSSLVSQRD